MKIRITPEFILSLGLIFLSNRLETALIFLSAALVHELGHMTLLSLLGIKKPELSLGLLGADIKADTSRLSYGEEALVYLGGILFNALATGVCTLCLRHSFDMRIMLFCLANILYALFNLLPVKHLDGGRVLECALLSRLDDLWLADRILTAVSVTASLTLAVLSVYITLSLGASVSLITLTLWSFYQCIPSKPFCRSTS